MRLHTTVFALVAMAAPQQALAQHQHDAAAETAVGVEGAGGEGMMAMCHAMMSSMMGQSTSSMIGRGMGSMMGQGMGSMMGQGMGSMMGQGLMDASPAALLRQREALALTPEQVNDLEALQEVAARQHGRHAETMASLAARREKLLAVETPNLDEIETILSEEAEVGVDMRMHTLRTSAAAVELLTEEQRSNVRYAKRMMSGMMKHMTRHGESAVDPEGAEDAHEHGSETGH